MIRPGTLWKLGWYFAEPGPVVIAASFIELLVAGPVGVTIAGMVSSDGS